MLDGLDDIQWDQLNTSFGDSAEDVPKNILQLLSDSYEDRKIAVRILRSQLCNTYILNTATLATIPFLIELLKSPNTQDKDQIIWILKNSLPYVEAIPELLAHNKGELVLQIRQKIVEVLDVYIDLLQDSDFRVRTASLFLIIEGVFPKSDYNRIHKAYEDLKKKEKHPQVVQHFDYWDSYLADNKHIDV